MTPFIADPKRVEPGTDLIEEGDNYSTAFVIHEGWAVRYRTLPDGRRQVINFLLPGDAFGLGSVILKRADHQVAALTPLTVSDVTPDALIDLLKREPRLGMAFLWGSAQEEAVLREHIVSVGRRNAYQRVAHLLLELMHRLELIGRVEHQRYELPLSQPLIADALGLSVVHANRTLRRLQVDGFIGLQARRLTIHDYGALKRIADFHRGYLHVPRHAAHPTPLKPA